MRPFAFSLLLLPFVAGFLVPDDEAEVRAAFDTYKTAILAADADAALTVLDQNTLAYYGRMLDFALHAEPDSVRALRSIDLLMVLTMRHRVEPAQLQAMDGRAALAHAIREGWIGRAGVESQTVGAIRIEGDTAYAEVLDGGTPIGLAWAFHREDGAWRLDLTSNMDVIGEAFEAGAADMEMEVEPYILMLLEYITGAAPDDSIWTPSAQR